MEMEMENEIETDGRTGDLLDRLLVPGLARGLEALLRLGLLLLALLQLAALELGRLPVEHVHRLDARLQQPAGAVQEALQVGRHLAGLVGQGLVADSTHHREELRVRGGGSGVGESHT